MIVVNYASEAYRRPERRLANSLIKSGVRYLSFSDLPEGSPSHQESPYEFKIHAIRKAMEIDPIVLWVDSSFWLVGDIGVIESIIVNDGYFMSEAGAWVGQWTNDHTKKYFNLSEEEGKVPGGMSMFAAGLLGLNSNSKVAMDYFEQWHESAKAGCFKGSHANHRHDQSAGSIIASRLGMKYQRGGQYMSYIGSGYSTPEEGSIFYLQGMA